MQCLFFLDTWAHAPPDLSMSHNEKRRIFVATDSNRIQCLYATEVTFVQPSGIVTLASIEDACPLMQGAQSRQRYSLRVCIYQQGISITF